MISGFVDDGKNSRSSWKIESCSEWFRSMLLRSFEWTQLKCWWWNRRSMDPRSFLIALENVSNHADRWTAVDDYSMINIGVIRKEHAFVPRSCHREGGSTKEPDLCRSFAFEISAADAEENLWIHSSKQWTITTRSSTVRREIIGTEMVLRLFERILKRIFPMPYRIVTYWFLMEWQIKRKTSQMFDMVLWLLIRWSLSRSKIHN